MTLKEDNVVAQTMKFWIWCNQEESNNVTPDQAENFQNSDIIH